MRKSKSLQRIVAVAALGTLILTAGAGACQALRTQANVPDNPSPNITEIVPDNIVTESFRIGSPRGAAALALAGWYSPQQSVADFPFSMNWAGSPDQLTALLATGQLDVALLPVNVAANLYNRTGGEIQLAAITAQGLFYAISADPSVTSITDLAGQPVISFGLGATPQYIIDYFAALYDINLDVSYAAEAPEAVARLILGQADTGILPEPFVTALHTQDPRFEIAFSLGDAWYEATGTPLVTTALVFRRDWAEANPELAQTVITQVGDSIDWVNANPNLAASTVVSLGILDNLAIAQDAIPRTNLGLITGDEMHAATQAFLTVLHNANPDSIGGSVPGAGFFFE